MNEKHRALAFASQFLDQPNADPDSGICVVSRQFGRALEEIDRLKADAERLKQTLRAAMNVAECIRPSISALFLQQEVHDESRYQANEALKKLDALAALDQP